MAIGVDVGSGVTVGEPAKMKVETVADTESPYWAELIFTSEVIDVFTSKP